MGHCSWRYFRLLETSYDQSATKMMINDFHATGSTVHSLNPMLLHKRINRNRLPSHSNIFFSFHLTFCLQEPHQRSDLISIKFMFVVITTNHHFLINPQPKGGYASALCKTHQQALRCVSLLEFISKFQQLCYRTQSFAGVFTTF